MAVELLVFGVEAEMHLKCQLQTADTRRLPWLADQPYIWLLPDSISSPPLPLVQCLSVTASGRSLAVSIIPTFLWSPNGTS